MNGSGVAFSSFSSTSSGFLPGARPVRLRDPEDVRVDRDGRLAEGDVEHDVGGLAADARQLLQLVAFSRYLAAEFVDQDARRGDHVLRLGVEQADGLDVLLEALLAEFEHCLRRFHLGEQRAGRLVDPDVGRLRRQRDRDQQRVRIHIFELGLRRRVGFRQAAVEFENVCFFHASSSKRSADAAPALPSACSLSPPRPTRKWSGISNQRPGTIDVSYLDCEAVRGAARCRRRPIAEIP